MICLKPSQPRALGLTYGLGQLYVCKLKGLIKLIAFCATNLTVTHLEHLGWSHFRPDPLKVFTQPLVSHAYNLLWLMTCPNAASCELDICPHFYPSGSL